jgi:hypothetical protein
MADGDEPVRRVTLGLFRQLGIDDELRHRIASLARHGPANRLYVEASAPDLGAIRIASRADARTCRHENLPGSEGEPTESAMAARTDE